MLLNIEYLKNKYNIKTNGIAHIGAHLGQEIDEYKKIFSDAEIHLFEPQEDIFLKLKNKYSNLEKLFFYNCALGEQKGVAELNGSDNDGQSSSILSPNLHLSIHPEVKFTNKQKVSVNKYDSFNLINVNFLNIDTQGYELMVLLGSINSLKNNVEYIICEVNKLELYENCPLVGDIDSFLAKFGFIRTDTHYWQDSFPWGDAFYIKKNNLNLGRILFSKLKNYIYSYEFLFPIIITCRNFVWKLFGK